MGRCVPIVDTSFRSAQVVGISVERHDTASVYRSSFFPTYLALASQSLSMVIALIPCIRQTFRRHLFPKQAVTLVEFDKLKHDYQERQSKIHTKLVRSSRKFYLQHQCERIYGIAGKEDSYAKQTTAMLPRQSGRGCRIGRSPELCHSIYLFSLGRHTSMSIGDSVPPEYELSGSSSGMLLT